jgi:hypothetical protein
MEIKLALHYTRKHTIGWLVAILFWYCVMQNLIASNHYNTHLLNFVSKQLTKFLSLSSSENIRDKNREKATSKRKKGLNFTVLVY